MIALQMQLCPQGDRDLRTPLVYVKIWTDGVRGSGAPLHCDVIYDAAHREIVRGIVPEDQSGHRNLLRLLDRLPGAGAHVAALRVRVERARRAILDHVGVLRDTGTAGRAALDAVLEAFAADQDRDLSQVRLN